MLTLSQKSIVETTNAKHTLASLFAPKHKLVGGIYEKHISYLNEVLQREMSNYDLPFKLRIVMHKELNDCINYLEEKGVFKHNAKVWENQVETFVEVIHMCYVKPWQSGVIGATQLGKTMTILLLKCSEAILPCKTGKKYKAIYLIPGRKNLETQTNRDYIAFTQLYDFEIEGAGENKVYAYSWIKNQIHIQMNSNESPTETNDIPIYRRSPGKIKKEVEKQIEIAHRENYNVILFIDECHWGAASESIMKDILYCPRDLTTKAEGDVMIAISATPFQVSYLDGLWKVKCRTYEGYIGYSFYNGELLDERYDPIVPDHVRFTSSTILEKFGVKDFKFVSRRYYKNIKAYTKAQRETKKRCLTPFAVKFAKMRHYDYKSWCENAIISLINGCLIHHNILNGRGFIIRFFTKKSDVTNFFLRKKHLFDKSLHLVPWQDTNSSMDIDDLLSEMKIGDKDYKVIFVTGNGHMGNRIKDESGIYYAADFAEDSTLTAVIQGLVGRLTGKKSAVPIIFLSEKSCEMLDKYIRTKGKYFGKAPHGQTTLIGEWQSGESVTIWIDEEDANGEMTFAEIENNDLGLFLEQYANNHCKNFASLPTGVMPDYRKNEFWSVFDEDTMGELEEELGLPNGCLVRYTPDETILSTPYTDHQGFAYDGTIGFRTVGNNLWRGSNAKTVLQPDRIVSGTRIGHRRLQPQLHVRKVQRGRSYEWKAVAIKFRFVNAEIVGDQVCLPTEKSVHNKLFACDYEKHSASTGIPLKMTKKMDLTKMVVQS